MIGLIGIDYKSAPLEIRELFSFNSEQLAEFTSILKESGFFKGLVLLFTCNRSEIYFNTKKASKDNGFSFLISTLIKYKGNLKGIESLFYFRRGEEAYRHLFKVISGLESMVFGEAQITSQVKEAYQASLNNGFIDPELSRLFEKALETGKKVRTETKINQGAFSVSYAGIQKCGEVFSNLKDHPIFLIGAGKTGGLTIQNLVKKGCDKIYISNRTIKNTRSLSEKYKTEVIPFEKLEEGMRKCDIIIVATSYQKYLIDRKMTERIQKLRNYKPYVLLDLSVPRNIDPDAKKVQGVHVFDIDLLNGVVGRNNLKRKELKAEAENIISKSCSEFSDWINVRKLKPIITQLNDSFREISKSELAGFKKINKAHENKLLDRYNEHITEKYTRLLTKNLRDVTENGRSTEYVDVLYKLFELS